MNMSEVISKKKTGIRYAEVVEKDLIPPVPDLLENAHTNIGVEGVPISRYTSLAFHQRELKDMWSKVWQFACRLEEISNIGDIFVYDLADYSFIIVRTQQDQVKAFSNSCPHRGTKLCVGNTSLKQFTCPFHGLSWNLEGALKKLPCEWDFPHIKNNELALDEVKSDLWEGFVFINMDKNARSLLEYLEDIPSQMSARSLGTRKIISHSQKILSANWKASMESFIEAFHIPELHYQTWKYQGIDSTQYDVFPHWKHMNRSIQPIGVQTFDNKPTLSQQEILDAWYEVVSGGKKAPKLQESETARNFISKWVRNMKFERSGVDYSQVSDSEMIDVIQYLLFPNTIFFRGVALPSLYRFRPNGNDPDSCIFDLYFFGESDKDAPKNPTLIMDEQARYTTSGQVPPWLGEVYDQDMDNLSNLQKGLKASRKKNIVLSHYQESRIRHFHQMLSAYVKE